MKLIHLVRNGIFALGMVVSMGLSLVPTALAQRASTAQHPAALPVPSLRDGQHDFDFEIGTWNIHLSRRVKRLEGSNEWVEFHGTSVTKPLWDGKSNIEQFETESPNLHIEGLTLRVYNPQTHQWSIYWASAKDPQLGSPIVPMIGQFNADGTGEFYDQETWNGRSVYVRFIWSKVTPNSAHFEQSFSSDGGKTWEVNWITDQTRVPDKTLQK
ncbi:MAG: hypothetical protein WB985_15915 [Candidatus Acidiferrales bacterium]